MLAFLIAIAAMDVAPPPPTSDPWYVVFDANSVSISPSQIAFLRHLLPGVSAGGPACAELVGHADAEEGSAHAKLALSERRVAQVKQFLVSSGMSAERITVRAVADHEPLTGSGGAMNRTVSGGFCR